MSTFAFFSRSNAGNVIVKEPKEYFVDEANMLHVTTFPCMCRFHTPIAFVRHLCTHKFKLRVVRGCPSFTHSLDNVSFTISALEPFS